MSLAELPKIISVDDHIIDPPTLWLDRLPAKYHDRAPRVVRMKAASTTAVDGKVTLVDSPDGTWADVWHYDDLRTPLISGVTAVGPTRGLLIRTMVTYDDILPGCWQQKARLSDMDLNWTEAQICFPQFPRFCGQTFLEREDKDLALLCVRAYNDFVIDEWCAGDGYGRLIPLVIVPLWDAELAAQEVRRCADKGAHAVTFSECPPFLKLPSLYTGYWDPFLQACQDTDTVVNLHVGSSSQMMTTSADAPMSVLAALNFVYLAAALCDWVYSGTLSRYPQLRLVLSEGQAGWMPYVRERIDHLWERGDMFDPRVRELTPVLPSSIIAKQVFGCIYDDLSGLRVRDQIGMSQLMFETDYPHSDSTFPDTKAIAEKLVAEAGLSEHETWQLLRGNAISCYRLDRFGITA